MVKTKHKLIADDLNLVKIYLYFIFFNFLGNPFPFKLVKVNSMVNKVNNKVNKVNKVNQANKVNIDCICI